MQQLSLALIQQGFAVHTMDFQGHGRSAGKRGYMGSYHDYLRDACTFITKMPDYCQQLPKFLLGLGLGATIISMLAAEFHARHPGFFAGLVLVSPAVKSCTWPGKRLFSKNVVMPDPCLLSKDSEVVSRYRTDALVFHGKITSTTATQIFKAMKWMRSRKSTAKIASASLLICQGSADQLMSPLGAKDFYEQTPSKDKDLKIYEGHQHDLLDGLESQKVIDDIVSWIKTRASKILAKDSFSVAVPEIDGQESSEWFEQINSPVFENITAEGEEPNLLSPFPPSNS